MGEFKTVVQTRDAVEIMHIENSPNSPECLDEAMKKVLYCFYKIFFKDNLTNEGKFWPFLLLIETDFLDTRQYFLPPNQNTH